jgi:hypothetical protein
MFKGSTWAIRAANAQGLGDLDACAGVPEVRGERLEAGSQRTALGNPRARRHEQHLVVGLDAFAQHVLA